MPEASPFAAGDRAAARTSERQAIPVRSGGLDRPSSGEADLDIPTFLRRKSG
jgi:hypothetical protein